MRAIPDTVFSLLDYLNRDQYGDNPLVYGAYFNHRPISIKEGKPSYYKGEENTTRWIRTGSMSMTRSAKGVFPRMWSTQDRHANEYIYWGGMQRSRSL